MWFRSRPDCNHFATKQTKRVAEMMTCPDCGESLDDVSAGDPCQSCGGERRSAVVSPQPVGAVAIVESVIVKVRKDDDRPWTEKWISFLSLSRSSSSRRTGSGSGSFRRAGTRGTFIADPFSSDRRVAPSPAPPARPPHGDVGRSTRARRRPN
jgi:hypothetical protein